MYADRSDKSSKAGGQDDPIKLKAMIKRQSTQAIDNYDNFHQTIMNLEPSQIEDSVCQTPQATNHYGEVI